jgi:glycosyltransferase involved in cell wall biosynthesis
MVNTKANARPRIAILTNYPYDGVTFTGGVETATAGLLEGLQKYVDEYDFHVFALTRTISQLRVEQREGMTFHFLAIPSVWYVKPNVIPNILNARAELKKLHADLVHCQDNMALAIAAISVKPEHKVFTIHGIKSVESHVWEGPEYWSHQMDALLERIVHKRFDEMITISPYVDRFLPVHVTKHHITNPVRKLFFERPQCGVNTRRLLFVGALTRLKRPMDVVQAFAIVRERFDDATLNIVGHPEDEQYEQELRQFVTEKKIAGVEFLGARSQSEVAALMRMSTALVLSSVQENTPMVVAESMASGLPVIASNVGGVSAMVQHGVNGLLFECGNIQELAGNIARLFEEESLRRQLSHNGKEKATTVYSTDAVASATVDVYRRILGRQYS